MLDFQSRERFLNIAGLFEGGLVFVALGLGWIVAVDPLLHLRLAWGDVVWGMLGGLFLFGIAMLGDSFAVSGFSRIKQLLVDTLGRPLALCRWYDLILLAVLAGFSEELLFRGVLQPWIERYLGRIGGLVLSNVAFGLAHAVTPLYAVLAGLVGGFLGWMMDATGERRLLVPMLTHGLYDYLAFLWVIREYRAQQQENDGDDSDTEANE
ncbi:MAG: lysostaphin resistance A-like protein [Planctomycetaceae bacterium]